MIENEKLGTPRTHPDFIESRRQRFAKLLRQAHKILKNELTEKERLSVKLLYEMIESKERG